MDSTITGHLIELLYPATFHYHKKLHIRQIIISMLKSLVAFVQPVDTNGLSYQPFHL